MKGKTLTKRLLALLVSLCLLLGGVTMAIGEETEPPVEQQNEASSGWEKHSDNDKSESSSHFEAGEKTSVETNVENEKLTVEIGDVDKAIKIGVSTEGSNSDIDVILGDDAADTREAFDDEGNPLVHDVVVNAGSIVVNNEDHAIGISTYDDDDEKDIGLTVRTGYVNADSEGDTSGAKIHAYNGDVDVTADDVYVWSDEGDAVGIDVAVEGDSQVNVQVNGDVLAYGETGAAIKVQGTDAEDIGENTKVNIVVVGEEGIPNGLIDGTDVAIQVTEEVANNTTVTAWEVVENEKGELAQLIGQDGTVIEGDDAKKATQAFEEAIQYIVKVAENFRDYLSVYTEHSVTVDEGEETVTYQTATEGEEVLLQIDLKPGEELRGIYYNDDRETEAEYIQDENDNFFVKMLRGGAMLLGLDIGRIAPEPVEEEEEDDDDDHHHHSKPRTEFVYVPVEENEPVHGVTAAERPTAQDTAHTVNAELNGGYQYVDIQNKIQVMNDEELSQFNELSIEDRILVMMVAMGLENTDGDFRSTMSDSAKALSIVLDDRLTQMSEDERAQLIDALRVYFPPRLITIDGVQYEAVGIVLVIDNNGEKTCLRYDFYNDNGVWKLYQIEKGKYITVD